MGKFNRLLYIVPLILTILFSNSAFPAPDHNWQLKIESGLLDAASAGETEYLVTFSEQTELEYAQGLPNKQEKGSYVVGRLKSTAQQSQKSFLDFLDSEQVEYQPFWITNAVLVKSNRNILELAARRSDVLHISANPSIGADLPGVVREREANGLAPFSQIIEWNISRVNAPQVWEAGFTGQGVVIGGQDTGYDWEHPALKDKYRGWNGNSVDHNYSWHDSIHAAAGSCGADSPEPCDDNGHGTHTMGTMLGDDGLGNQIGMAPGAKWIGCRNMDQAGVGKASTYIECFQWFLQPTDLNNQNGNVDLAPHVINNSWYCPPEENCNWDSLQTAVDNARAAGIVVVTSTGNEGGSGCGSVGYPPAIYDSSFSVGATDNNDNIALFSSRGPSDYTSLMKPEISAPGVSVRSSVPKGGYGLASGTSMAAPHVSGLVALLISANPHLAGQVEQIESIIEKSALPRQAAESCGGISGNEIPNNTYGWGRIDARETIFFEKIYFPLSPSPNN